MEFDLEKALATISENFDSEKFEEKQAELRTALSVRLKMRDSADEKFEHGLRAIALSEKALARLDKEKADDLPLIQFELIRLAEGYALTGQIQKAYEITPDATKRAEYAQILGALNTSGQCQCPVKSYSGKQGRIRVTPRREKEKIYFNGRKYTIFQCVDCGTSYHV
jgi:hypothetical protein